MRATTSRRPRATRLAGLAAAAALLLAGCGEAHPGAAAVVGGQTVTTDEVDGMTDAICTAATQSSTGTLPLGYLNGLAVEAAVKRAVGDQLAKEYGLSAGVAYNRAVSQLETQALGLPEEVQAPYVTWQGAAAYLSDISEQVARRQLSEEGAGASVDEVTARAQAVVAGWVQEHPLSVDPRYELRASGDAYARSGSLLVPADSTLSVPVSDDSKVAGYLGQLIESSLRDQQDPERLPDAQAQDMFAKLTAWAATLPADQRCPGVVAG